MPSVITMKEERKSICICHVNAQVSAVYQQRTLILSFYFFVVVVQPMAFNKKFNFRHTFEIQFYIFAHTCLQMKRNTCIPHTKAKTKTKS